MKARDRILKTASKLFHTRGYNSTGINQIIEEASVAKGSFYYNFKSKEEVCIAFLNARHTYWFESLKNFIELKGNREHPILLAFSFLIDMNIKENFRGCSFLNILSEIPSDNSKILKVLQNHKKDLRQYISSLVKNGDLSDHIYLLFESSIIESQLYRDQWPVKKSKEIVKHLIQ
ncbi:TetR/AcrR family transcriptional regulator [Maribacter sp. 2308TA10-17]|uniref:TetR/AcrR family transcriptional regulator n=1 Tax=Maribacter sp. 2308TA10-17 TaxID=3386276 RepID=UPI0039BD2D7E